MTQAPRFNPPVQQRSEQTLERLVSAARQALETKDSSRLTLAEITQRAGVTVGAFYRRFDSKAAFIEYLQSEAYEQIRQQGQVLFGGDRTGPERTIRELLEEFVTSMARMYQDHRGVMREIVQESRSDRERQRRRMDMTREVTGLAVDWMLEQGGPVGHPEPKKALRVALLFATSALRDVILFDETWMSADAQTSVDDLVEELVEATAAYLRLPL